MDNLKIKELSKTDIDSVGELIKSDWVLHAEQTPLYDKAKVIDRDINHWLEQRVLKDEDFFVLLAKLEDKVVGALLGRISETMRIATHEYELIIEDIVTDLQYRRKGIAQLLVKASEDYAKAKGIKQMTAHIYVFNEASRRLFSSIGYTKEIETYHKFISNDN